RGRAGPAGEGRRQGGGRDALAARQIVEGGGDQGEIEGAAAVRGQRQALRQLQFVEAVDAAGEDARRQAVGAAADVDRAGIDRRARGVAQIAARRGVVGVAEQAERVGGGEAGAEVEGGAARGVVL